MNSHPLPVSTMEFLGLILAPLFLILVQLGAAAIVFAIFTMTISLILYTIRETRGASIPAPQRPGESDKWPFS